MELLNEEEVKKPVVIGKLTIDVEETIKRINKIKNLY